MSIPKFQIPTPTGSHSNKGAENIWKLEFGVVEDASVSSLSKVLSRNHDGIARRHGIPERRFELRLDALDQPHDLDAVHRAILTDAAGQGQRLQYGGVVLEDVSAGRLDLPEDVDALGAGHEDRVAVPQLDVLLTATALQVADPGADDVRFAAGRG